MLRRPHPGHCGIGQERIPVLSRSGLIGSPVGGNKEKVRVDLVQHFQRNSLSVPCTGQPDCIIQTGPGHQIVIHGAGSAPAGHL